MAIGPISAAGAIPLINTAPIASPPPVSDAASVGGITGGASGVGGAGGGNGFGDLISKGIEALSQTENRADSLVQAAASGQDVQPHQLMIATSEAQLATELAVSMRNKAIDAYREIMNMQL